MTSVEEHYLEKKKKILGEMKNYHAVI